MLDRKSPGTRRPRYYTSDDEARADLLDDIQLLTNRMRRHGCRGNLSPSLFTSPRPDTTGERVPGAPS